jgi:hypothetical protein
MDYRASDAVGAAQNGQGPETNCFPRNAPRREDGQRASPRSDTQTFTASTTLERYKTSNRRQPDLHVRARGRSRQTRRRRLHPSQVFRSYSREVGVAVRMCSLTLNDVKLTRCVAPVPKFLQFESSAPARSCELSSLRMRAPQDCALYREQRDPAAEPSITNATSNDSSPPLGTSIVQQGASRASRRRCSQPVITRFSRRTGQRFGVGTTDSFGAAWPPSGFDGYTMRSLTCDNAA